MSVLNFQKPAERFDLRKASPMKLSGISDLSRSPFGIEQRQTAHLLGLRSIFGRFYSKTALFIGDYFSFSSHQKTEQIKNHHKPEVSSSAC